MGKKLEPEAQARDHLKTWGVLLKPSIKQKIEDLMVKAIKDAGPSSSGARKSTVGVVECTDEKGKKALRLFYTGCPRKGSRGKMNELFPENDWRCKNVDVLGVVAVEVQHADLIKSFTIAEMRDKKFLSQVSARCSKCRRRHRVLTLDEGHDTQDVVRKVFIPIAKKWREFCETCL